jgi:cardiolipin synthase
MRKTWNERKRKWIEKTVDNDRRYKAIIYNRALMCILLTLVQLGVSIALLLLTELGWLWQLGAGLLSLLYVVYLAGREQRRPTRVLWIILLLLAPIVGVPCYLLYGDGKPTVALRKKHARAERVLSEYWSKPSAKAERTGGVPTMLARLGYPTYRDGDVCYYPTGKELFSAMMDALQSAEKFVLMEYFILAGGKMWGQLL